MKLQVRRRFKGDEYTIGSLYIDGKYFCDTLEDKVRDLSKEPKVYSKTAIPAGSYKVIVNYSPKFKRELPRLLNVPHFEGILLHRGNTAQDSAGCVLLGENKVKGMVINSTQYEVKLTQILKEVLSKGESVTIEIN